MLCIYTLDRYFVTVEFTEADADEFVKVIKAGSFMNYKATKLPAGSEGSQGP